MKIAYIDCSGGIAGDMFAAAMLDAGLSKQVLLKELKKLRIPNLTISITKTNKAGIVATRFIPKFKKKPIYQPKTLKQLHAVINKSKLSKTIKQKAKKALTALAKSEAKLHGTTLKKLHFHELGAFDTIVDICSAFITLGKLEIDKVYCSTLSMGTGTVKTEHGKFPFPGPATISLLPKVPVFFTGTRAELVTPTGALILKSVTDSFGEMPEMLIERVGYGAGKRNKPVPSLLRVFIGKPLTKKQPSTATLIQTNIDDMQPQLFENLSEKLFQAAAYDVWLTPIQMKKSRPAIELSVLCNPKNLDKTVKVIFQETTTIGLRISNIQKQSLERKEKTIKTKFGKVKFKFAYLNGNIVNSKPEYAQCKKLAKKFKIPLKKVYQELAKY